MPAEPSARPAAELLHELMRYLYLSTACAADDHGECRQVDKYRGLPCCCTVCDHTDLDGTPPPACTPLLHYAEAGERRPGYTYSPGEPLGVRNDLVDALGRVLAHHVPQLSRSLIVHQLGVAAALTFAPRSGP